MIFDIKKLSTSIEPYFKNIPPLPHKRKVWINKNLPIISFITAIIVLVASYNLWNNGHSIETLLNYQKQLSNLYGGSTAITSGLGFFYWLSLIILIINFFVLLSSYYSLKKHLLVGWNRLFLATTINFIYGLVSVFDTGYGSFASFLFCTVVSLVAFYVLFQIKPLYLAKKHKK